VSERKTSDGGMLPRRAARRRQRRCGVVAKIEADRPGDSEVLTELSVAYMVEGNCGVDTDRVPKTTVVR
jgi:hypothetical protein